MFRVDLNRLRAVCWISKWDSNVVQLNTERLSCSGNNFRFSIFNFISAKPRRRAVNGISRMQKEGKKAKHEETWIEARKRKQRKHWRRNWKVLRLDHNLGAQWNLKCFSKTIFYGNLLEKLASATNVQEFRFFTLFARRRAWCVVDEDFFWCKLEKLRL